MTLGAHQEVFALHLAMLIIKATELGYGVRIGEAERTVEQQKLYMANGRSTTMNSMHLKRCAADLHFTRNGVLCYPASLGDFWEGLDPANKWGGNWKTFKDQPHFQRTV